MKRVRVATKRGSSKLAGAGARGWAARGGTHRQATRLDAPLAGHTTKIKWGQDGGGGELSHSRRETKQGTLRRGSGRAKHRRRFSLSFVSAAPPRACPLTPPTTLKLTTPRLSGRHPDTWGRSPCCLAGRRPPGGRGGRRLRGREKGASRGSESEQKSRPALALSLSLSVSPRAPRETRPLQLTREPDRLAGGTGLDGGTGAGRGGGHARGEDGGHREKKK